MEVKLMSDKYHYCTKCIFEGNLPECVKRQNWCDEGKHGYYVEDKEEEGNNGYYSRNSRT